MPDNPEPQPDPPSDPGQAVSAPLRRRLQQCYDHGTRLMAQPTYDFNYAHSLLVECVINDPANHLYQEAFLKNLQKKHNHNKRGSLLKFSGRGGFKKAVSRSDWPKVLRLGPPILKANPWDVPTLCGLASACGAYGFFETELRYLRTALEVKPHDAAVNRQCATALARIGRFDEAIACWQRVDEAKNGDAEAQQTIAELQVAKSEKRTSFGPRPPRAASAREADAQPATGAAAAATEGASGGPSPAAGIQLTERQQLEQALVLNPTNTEAYLRLADLHTESGRLGEAAHLLTKGLAASGQDLQIQERLEEIEILRKQEQLLVAQQRVAAAPDEERRSLAERLQSDLDRYELEVYDRRAERYPEDLELKYQVAVRLKRCGNFRQAVEMFAQAAELEQHQATATFERAECLQRLKKYDVSFEQYRRAAALAADSRQPEIHQLALYRAGILAAGLGNHRAAEQCFAELLELCPDYRDAASRLDKIRQMRHKE